MPGALMLLLALAVGTLASYVALDLARRVRVVRTRSGGLWLFGAAAALSLGIWSSQIIGIAAEPLAFPLGYDGADLAHRLGGGAGGRPGRARRRQRQDRHPRAGRPGRVRARQRHRRRQRALVQCARPAARHRLAGAGAGRGGVGRLRRLHDGARRLLPRRRPQQAADRALADDRGTGARRHPGREPAARRRRRRARGADRVAPCRPDRLDDARPVRLGRLDRPAGGRPDPLDPRGAPAPVAASRRERAAAPFVPRRPDPPAEPADVRRHAGPGGAAGRRQRRAHGDAVHRPRRLQAGQRVARPSHGRPDAARDRGPAEALRPARRPGGAPRRRRVPDADPRQSERGGRRHLRRADAGPDRRAVQDERPRGRGLELDRHRHVSGARGDAGPDRPCRGGDARRQERRRRHALLLRGAHGERRARPVRPAARPAPGPRRGPAASAVPAQGARAERRNHRRRGADALEPSAARRGGADGVHPDRRALRPDRRDRQLADRRGLPPGGPVARRRPAHAGGDQPLGAPAAPCGPRRPDRCRAQAPSHQPASAHLRDHRIGGDGRRVERDPDGGEARRDGRQHLDRRLRHRLLEPRLPSQAPRRRAEDRPQLRPGPGGQRRCPRGGRCGRQAGPGARPQGRRRGGRDRGPARDPARPRLPRAAGLPVRPADVGDGPVRLGDGRRRHARRRVPRLALPGDGRRRTCTSARVSRAERRSQALPTIGR